MRGWVGGGGDIYAPDAFAVVSNQEKIAVLCRDRSRARQKNGGRRRSSFRTGDARVPTARAEMLLTHSQGGGGGGERERKRGIQGGHTRGKEQRQSLVLRRVLLVRGVPWRQASSIDVTCVVPGAGLKEKVV